MNILSFGAHPDDIEIGMGGTIAKYTKNNHNVIMVVATLPSKEEVRTKEAQESAKILGAKLITLKINPEDMLLNRKLIKSIDEIIKKYRPDVVFTHWIHDSHQDHVVISNAVIASTRKNDCSVYMYEQTIPGGIVPYGFKPQMFIDISETIDIKIKSILAHKSQMDKNGDWWLYGIKGRAMYRGYQINVKYAEAFEVIKEIKSLN